MRFISAKVDAMKMYDWEEVPLQESSNEHWMVGGLSTPQPSYPRRKTTPCPLFM